MSVTQQVLLQSALCLWAKNDSNATGRLPCKCFLKFEILTIFTRPSRGNLQSEKHTANVLMEPRVWSDSVYISLIQFENNAIWHKRQVDEMSESFFFFFLGIIVEWVEQSHGKTESWLRLLALWLTSCDSGQETWLRPRNYYRTDWEESHARICTVSSLLGFQKIGKVIQQTAAKPHALQPVSSGQVVKRAFEAQTLTGVSVGAMLGCWTWKQDGGLGECDKKGCTVFGNPSGCGMSAWTL